MRFPLIFYVIGVVSVIAIASALYPFTPNSTDSSAQLSLSQNDTSTTTSTNQHQSVHPGDSYISLTFQGYSRSYYLHVPPQYDGKTPLPLVFALHSFGGDASAFANQTNFNAKADTEGFFVVYPQGLSNSWNAGSCCGPSSEQNVDDVGFIKELMIELKDNLAVNDSRVYACGGSNGGMLAYRLACTFSDDIAAIAPVAATFDTELCNATTPVSVVAFHGTADEIIPYSEVARVEGAYPVPSALDAVSYWIQRDGIISTSQDQVGDDLTVTTYGEGLNGTEVMVYTLNGGGHAWPTEISTTDLIWRFFEMHPKQSA